MLGTVDQCLEPYGFAQHCLCLRQLACSAQKAAVVRQHLRCLRMFRAENLSIEAQRLSVKRLRCVESALASERYREAQHAFRKKRVIHTEIRLTEIQSFSIGPLRAGEVLAIVEQY